MQANTKYVSLFKKDTSILGIFSTFSLLKAGQKLKDTLSILITNNVNGSSLIMLYNILNTNNSQLSWGMHLDLIYES